MMAVVACVPTPPVVQKIDDANVWRFLTLVFSDRSN